MRVLSTCLCAALFFSGCSFKLSENPEIIPAYDHLVSGESPVDTLSSGTGRVLSIDFEPARNRLATLTANSAESSTLEFWFADSGKLERSFYNPDFLDLVVRFSNDGKSVAIGSTTLIVIRSDNFKLRRAFTADAYMDEKLIGLDTETAWPFAIKDVEMRKKYHYVSALAFSPDDRFLVSGHDNNLIRVWELKTGALLKTLEMSRIHGSVTGVEFSPDGRFIAATQYKGKVHIWRFPDYRETILELEKEPVNAISFDPFSGMLATGCSDGSITIYDIEELKMFKEIKVHLREIQTLEFSSDGLYIVSAGTGRTLALTEVFSGRPLVYFEGHSDAVNDVALNSNASLLASSSDDGTVLLWDISRFDLGKDPAAIPTPVAPPKLSCEVEYVDGSGDGQLSEGESSTLRISVSNEGGGAAYQLVSMALPDSTGPVVSIGKIPVIPMILPGRTVTIEASVIIKKVADRRSEDMFHLRIYEFNGFHLPRPVRFRVPVK